MEHWFTKAVLACLAFAIGFIIVVGLEIALIALISEAFDKRISPRGLGWVALPIGGGVLAATLALEFIKDPTARAAVLKARLFDIANSLRQKSASRYTLAAALVWWMILGVLVWGVGLFGPYWDRSEWNRFWVLLLAPPLIALADINLFQWARNTAK